MPHLFFNSSIDGVGIQRSAVQQFCGDWVADEQDLQPYSQRLIKRKSRLTFRSHMIEIAVHGPSVSLTRRASSIVYMLWLSKLGKRRVEGKFIFIRFPLPEF
jgi:hypothetical protein